MTELPGGWVDTNLVSCLEKIIDYRGKTPKKADKGVITLSAKSVKMGKIDYSQAYYISEETYKSFMVRGFPKKGDILMTTEAPLGCIAKLDRDNISIAQRLLTLRGKAGVLNNDYLMYYLTSRIGQHELHSRASGSTVQGIKRSEFEHVKILLPSSFEEQRTIAKILFSFDEKIELLREQNKTLETLAQTIFKEWFVNFNYPDTSSEMKDSELGKIPKEWHVGRLGDVLEIKRGGSPRTIKDYIADSGYRWLKISDATATKSPFILKIKERIKKEGLNKTTLLKNGALILSNSATPEIPKFLEIDSCIHDGWLHFPGTDVFSYRYLYLFFKHIRVPLLQQGNGSVFKNLKTDILKNWVVSIPDDQTMIKFDDLIQPNFEKIKNNANQIPTLAEIRNTLLPKLMSGEVRV